VPALGRSAAARGTAASVIVVVVTFVAADGVDELAEHRGVECCKAGYDGW